MKMMPASCYTTYRRILRTLRSRDEKIHFFMMAAAADLALELEADEPDMDRVQKLRERLGLEGEGA